MRGLWSIQNRRRVAILFLVAWAGVWLVTVATWRFDARGYSEGMPPPVFFAHLALPLVGAALLSAWLGRQDGGGENVALAGVWVVLSGVVIAAADFAVFLAWDQWLFVLHRVLPASRRPPVGPSEVVVFFALFVIVGLLAGVFALALTRGFQRR